MLVNLLLKMTPPCIVLECFLVFLSIRRLGYDLWRKYMNEISVHMRSSHTLGGEFSADESAIRSVQEMKRLFADLYVMLLKLPPNSEWKRWKVQLTWWIREL